MIALRISLNGKHHCTAGANDLDCLAAILTAKGKLGPDTHPITPLERPRFRLSVRGLTSRNNPEQDLYLQWAAPSVGIGDRLTIEVVETRRADNAHSTEELRVATRRRKSRSPSKKARNGVKTVSVSEFVNA
jgi:hypothetical protein